MKNFGLPSLLLCIFFHTSLVADTVFNINGVDGPADANILLFLQGLSEPEHAQNTGYKKRVEESTRDALLALGYYHAQIAIDVAINNKQNIVTLTIHPGPQTRITALDIKLTGAGQSDPHFNALVNNFSLKVNDILNHGHYEKAKSRLQTVARSRGYFDAKYDKSLVEVTSKSNSAVIYLWFNTGPRYQFGELSFSPDIPAEKQIRSLQNFKPGDPFEYETLRKFNTDISRTGYFKNIIVLPEINAQQALQIPLTVIATMRPEDSFNVGLGYSTDEKARGKLRWLRPWVNDDGHSIEGNLVASSVKQEVSFTYKIPLEDAIYDYASMQTGYQRVDLNDTYTQQYLVALSRHWRTANQWLRTLTIKYDHETGTQGQQDFSIRSIIPGVSYVRNYYKGGINPTWAEKKLISLEGANKWWLSDEDFIKFYGQLKFIRSYGEHQLLAATELGAIIADSIDHVPSSLRFFTGGDQSVRGYNYESIASRDEQGFLTGGLYLSVASLEYRYPVAQTWKLALFSDVGTATNDYAENFSSSAGIGAVWSSPVGPIRLYLARPFSKNTSSLALHFMIGPE